MSYHNRFCRRVKKIIDASQDNIAIGGDYDEEVNYISPTILRNVKFTGSSMQQEVQYTSYALTSFT